MIEIKGGGWGGGVGGGEGGTPIQIRTGVLVVTLRGFGTS